VVHYGVTPADYITDVMADTAVAFIAEPDPRPFFLFFAPPAPHSDTGANGPVTPAPRHRGRYSHLSAPQGPAFNEADVSEKPPELQGRPLLTDGDIANLDYEYRTRVESLLAMDEAVELVVEALAASGKLDNTYIFFTSDNGYHLGEHRLPGGKGTFFEEDIRVPLLVRGPGIAPGSERDHFVLNIDFAPTIVELAGVPAGRSMDGLSLVPLFWGATPAPASWRRDFLVQIHLPPAAVLPGGEQIRALRTADWLYAEYAVDGTRQLYDLRADPYQLESRHDTAPQALIDSLAARLHALAECVGVSCRS
jgi:N-acetylglucosamine-6-sulfatase